MSAEAPRGAIPVSARPGTGHLSVDAGRWPVGVRVAPHIIYTPIAALAAQTL